MTKTVIATGALALALLAITFAPSAKADEWNKKTLVTVHDHAVQIQGTVLEPGQYVLELADSVADRRRVEIFNADQTKLEATIFADSAYRVDATGGTKFTFAEVAPGQPPAISTWFYPGENYGLRFSVR